MGNTKQINRVGFHYYPDTLHYRETDLQTWLPELNHLGAGWLTLQAPVQRAIPEYFISGLVQAGIQPVLHFHLSTDGTVGKTDLLPLIQTYANWGVRYIALFDRPNCQQNWMPGDWAQAALVDRFLDLYLPLAEVILQQGMVPVFPPLQPGGDYWDLAFLRTALLSLHRRGKFALLESVILGAYAWMGKNPPDWGAGGPERWPGARPYFTPEGVQDHLGFRIFDWYQAIADEILAKPLPILILAGGYLLPDQEDWDGERLLEKQALHANHNMQLARLLQEDQSNAGSKDLVPPEVLACNFWLLACADDNQNQKQAWFKPDGTYLPVVAAFRRWIQFRQPMPEKIPQSPIEQAPDPAIAAAPKKAEPEPVTGPDVTPVEIGSADYSHIIDHYVLLPTYAWGEVTWDLDLIRRVFKDEHPTIGFSISEARHARRVTVVAGEGAFTGQALEMLRLAGCRVERLIEDGTLVATD